MAERRDDESRQEDLDWLYGDEETEAEKTRVDSPPVRGSSRRRPGTASPKAYPPLRTSQSRPAGPRTDRP
ncbi:MAG: LytR family transcriptional regulator, partial [Acidipropionibacterium acidipropionici]|nr:LytR family transcriptional regulator [Acidipropionibacterium acidipropionici]